MTYLFFFLLSLVVLLLGANYFVNYSLELAKKLRLSPLIIGATAVAIGTSLPEIVIAINSSLSGQVALVTANIVGANISNAGFILGLAFLFGKIRIGTRKTQILSLLMLFSTFLFVFFTFAPEVFAQSSALLLLIFSLSVFCWELYAGEKGNTDEDAVLFKKDKLPDRPLFLILFLTVFSFLVVYFTGQFFVKSAVNLAQYLKIPITVFGLTAVSLGTTLPELTTTLVAVFKKESKLILGNMVGSIIYNLLLVGGLGGIIYPLSSVPLFSLISMVLMVSFLAFLIRFYRGKIVPSCWGIFLLAGYLLFLLLAF